jgi:hypothetical protein
MKQGKALLPLHPIPTAKPNFQSGSFYLAKNRNFLLGLDRPVTHLPVTHPYVDRGGFNICG